MCGINTQSVNTQISKVMMIITGYMIFDQLLLKFNNIMCAKNVTNTVIISKNNTFFQNSLVLIIFMISYFKVSYLHLSDV